MPLVSLDLKLPPPDNPPVPLPAGSPYPRLTFHTINRRIFPVRGLLFSFLFHEIAIIALMFIPTYFFPSPLNPPDKQWEATIIPKDNTLYLPELGGGQEGGSPKKADSGGSEGGDSSPAAATNLGMTYAGPQRIVSNPPNPTNHIQTILQPDLPKPPILKTFVPLPNIVTLAQAPPPPPPTLAPPPPSPKPVEAPPQRIARNEPQVVIPVASVAAPRTIEAPKLILPATPTNTNAIFPVPSAPVRPDPVTPPPKDSEVKPVARPPQELPVGDSKNARNLLVLSPVPAQANAEPQIPEGESRGQFAISLQANSDPSLTGPGSAAGTKSANALGVGATSGSGGGDATGSGAGGHGGGGNGGGAGSGIGAGKGGTGNGSGTGTGSGGRGAGGSGGGSGTGIGPGAGHGTGSGHGTGTGAGAGPGGGPFAGMTIQGAEGPAGGIVISGASGASNNPPAKGHPLESYGLTVVSTGNSGGGVGDFGVFRDEAVFTVYLNPSSSADDPAASWALQYSVLYADSPLRDLVPPYPAKKEMPAWPADLLTKYKGQEMVVSAVIDEEGKMQHLKVLQSPNASLSEALLAVLDHWVFRPATVNGQPVAVKAVLGVPISAAR